MVGSASLGLAQDDQVKAAARGRQFLNWKKLLNRNSLAGAHSWQSMGGSRLWLRFTEGQHCLRL